MKFNFENAKDQIRKGLITTGSLIATAVPAFAQETQTSDSRSEKESISVDKTSARDSLELRDDTILLDQNTLEQYKKTEYTFAELEKIYIEQNGETGVMMGSAEVEGWGTTWYDVEGDEVRIKYKNNQGEKIKETFASFAELEHAHPAEYPSLMDAYQMQYQNEARNVAYHFLTGQLTETLSEQYADFQPDETFMAYIENLAQRRVNGENLDGYDDIIAYLLGNQDNGKPAAEYRATKKYGYNIYELASHLQQNQFDAFVKKFEGGK